MNSSDYYELTFDLATMVHGFLDGTELRELTSDMDNSYFFVVLHQPSEFAIFSIYHREYANPDAKKYSIALSPFPFESPVCVSITDLCDPALDIDKIITVLCNKADEEFRSWFNEQQITKKSAEDIRVVRA